MNSRESIGQIHIVNATKDGADPAFSSLFTNLSKIPPNGFVAIDAEFSGLVSDPDLSNDNLGKRYAAIRRIADTRAIFSVGVSVFNPIPQEKASASGETMEDENEPKQSEYQVSTYDFLLNCQDDFSTNANAGTFLVAHGFDFARMFQRGILYNRASTEKPKEGAGGKDVEKEATPWRWGKLPRGLLWRIGRAGVPIVLHNGLFDLAFLFAAFQGPLPPTLDGFIGQLLDCCPAGYWDSKVLADAAGERASYLGYVFAKAVLQSQVLVRNHSSLPSNLVTDPPEEDLLLHAEDTMCALYSFRGFCPRGVSCPFSHDPFLVVEEEKEGKVPKDSKAAYKKHKAQSKELKRRKTIAAANMAKISKKQKRKLLRERQRQVEANGTATIEHSKSEEAETEQAEQDSLEVSSSNEKKVHTAGWDAFCTGFVFAVYRETIPAEKLKKDRNRIAAAKRLSGVLLSKSSYGHLDEVQPRETSGEMTDT